MITAYPTFLWSFVGVKSESVTTRYLSSFRATGRNEDLKSVCKLGYSLDLLVSVVAFVLVSATSWWVAPRIFHMSEMTWLMLLYAASFLFFSLTATSRAILLSWQRFRWLGGLLILGEGITFIVVLGLLLAGFGVPGMVLGTAVAHVIIGLLMMGAATYVLHCDGVGLWWNAPLGNVAPLRKELTAFFGCNYLTVTLMGVIAQVPVMLLGHLRAPEEAGFYRLATSLTTVGSYLESSLGQVVYPALSARWGAGERESLRRSLKRWTLQAGFPIGVLVLLTIPFLPILVPIVFGPSYRRMILGAQILMVGTAVSAMFFWLNSFYYASGRISPWMKAYSFYTAFVISLGWISIEQWGYVGIASIVAVGKVLFTVSLIIVIITGSEKSS
jgi:O-antigen/teichoic acid export membrane protein